MPLRHPATLTLAFVLITSPLMMSADNGTGMSDFDACLKTLNISTELASVGTYKSRMNQCVRQRELTRLNLDRNLRNTMRFSAVQSRMTRNSRATVFKAITPHTSQEMMLPKIYRTMDPRALQPIVRPSRRAISSGKNNNSKAIRDESADVRAQRLLKALDACKLYTSDYEHSNCVRNKMVEQGS